MFSGAVVRYRAYGSKGLTVSEIGILVAFCSFTFALGTLLLSAIVLLIEPEIVERFASVVPIEASISTAVVILLLIGLYLIGSVVGFRPVRTRWFRLDYPKASLAIRQLFIAPIELLGRRRSSISPCPRLAIPAIWWCSACSWRSFSAALLSHAPGGIGVLELMFVAALPELPPASVLAALAVFRLLYLVVPFVIALVVVVIFERGQFVARRRAEKGLAPAPIPRPDAAPQDGVWQTFGTASSKAVFTSSSSALSICSGVKGGSCTAALTMRVM